MKRALAVTLLGGATLGLFAGYTYYYSDSLTSINTANWTQNGTLSPTASGLTTADTNGGSLISTLTAPGDAANYEVKSTITLGQSGGNYTQYLRATTNAMLGPLTQGSFFAADLQNPTFVGSSCTATLVLYSSVNASLTVGSSGTVTCHSGMVMRSVMVPGGIVLVFIDNAFVASMGANAPLAGQPGIGIRGAPAVNFISQTALGPRDNVVPNSVVLSSAGSSSFPNRVDLQWQGVADDPNGIGFWRYEVVRNGTYMGAISAPEFSDSSVLPSTTYTYDIYTNDQHFNRNGPTHITVVTPQAGSIEPRRPGVRPTGTYFGGMGENIDLASGNLNFTLPLLKAKSRSGGGASFNLSYNSSNWRQDTGGVWNLGRDTGYGYGWKLQAGSLTPYWSDYLTYASYCASS